MHRQRLRAFTSEIMVFTIYIPVDRTEMMDECAPSLPAMIFSADGRVIFSELFQ
jgi:hypothetical protein